MRPITATAACAIPLALMDFSLLTGAPHLPSAGDARHAVEERWLGGAQVERNDFARCPPAGVRDLDLHHVRSEPDRQDAVFSERFPDPRFASSHIDAIGDADLVWPQPQDDAPRSRPAREPGGEQARQRQAEGCVPEAHVSMFLGDGAGHEIHRWVADDPRDLYRRRATIDLRGWRHL